MDLSKFTQFQVSEIFLRNRLRFNYKQMFSLLSTLIQTQDSFNSRDWLLAPMIPSIGTTNWLTSLVWYAWTRTNLSSNSQRTSTSSRHLIQAHSSSNGKSAPLKSETITNRNHLKFSEFVHQIPFRFWLCYMTSIPSCSILKLAPRLKCGTNKLWQILWSFWDNTKQTLPRKSNRSSGYLGFVRCSFYMMITR